jgi:hypothetical protein
MMIGRLSSRPRTWITLMGVLGALGLHASSASATTTLRVAIGTLSTEAAGDAALEGPLRSALEQALDALPTVDRTAPARAQVVVQGSLVRLERTPHGVRAEVSLLVSERRGGAVRMLLTGRAEARGGRDPVPASITAAVRSAMRPPGRPSAHTARRALILRVGSPSHRT